MQTSAKNPAGDVGSAATSFGNGPTPFAGRIGRGERRK